MAKLLIFCFLSLFLGCFLSRSGYGQTWAVGGGPSYNINFDSPGFNLRGYYFLNHRICFGPELIGFLPNEHQTAEGRLRIESYEINLNGHYIFQLNEHFGVFPLVGLNYTYERERFLSVPPEGEHRVGEVERIQSLGVNMGGGLHAVFGRYIPFLEYEYVRGTNLDEHILTSGLFIALGRLESETKEEE